VFGASSHANDDRLIRRYMAERGWRALSAREQRVVRHLAACPACEARYRDLVLWLDAAAFESEHQADAVFPAERLAHQRDRILRRLEAHGQRARVLPFPVPAVGSRTDSLRGRPALRWVAAAAVAGLMIGLGTGRLLDLRRLTGPAPRGAVQTMVARQADAVAPAGLQRFANPVVSDETFLSELDDAVAGPRTPELEAIGALTLPRPTGGIVPASFKN
jgi:hypothetical protein